MKNREIARIFRNIALLLQIKGEMIFKIRAYERAAQLLDTLDEDIEDIVKKGGVDNLPGIGPALAKKIIQYVEEGKIDHYDKLRKSLNVDVEELSKVQGMGPKTILKLYKNLSVKNIKDLEKAAKEHKLSQIKGLGKVVEQNILKSISFALASSDRKLLGESLEVAERIQDVLKKMKEVQEVDIAGSLRRKKETIGDIDLLVASSNSKKVMDAFTNLKGVDKILAKGSTKSSIRLEGMQVDVRVVKKEVYGAALLHFTGSKNHNIALRKIALRKGMKVSEYGIFDKKTDKVLAAKTEQECYKKLGLHYIEPELREDQGEIRVSQQNKLPKLVELKDFKGDLHLHTTWSDGEHSIEEMARKAEELGHDYIAVTDHVGKAGLGRAMPPEQLQEQRKEIENTKTKIAILHGAEINIQGDGSLDIPNSILKKLDIVIASIHSGFKQPKENTTKRMLKAMENEHVDIIGHPTGRILNRRPGYEIDFEQILEKAKETKTILEINASQHRLDLNDTLVHTTIKAGVKISIGTDAHSTERLSRYPLGVYTARRGWATKKDIVNTLSLSKLKKVLSK